MKLISVCETVCEEICFHTSLHCFWPTSQPLSSPETHPISGAHLFMGCTLFFLPSLSSTLFSESQLPFTPTPISEPPSLLLPPSNHQERRRGKGMPCSFRDNHWKMHTPLFTFHWPHCSYMTTVSCRGLNSNICAHSLPLQIYLVYSDFQHYILCCSLGSYTIFFLLIKDTWPLQKIGKVHNAAKRQ